MSIQSVALWTGQYSNCFYRALGRDLERITRPLRWQAHGFAETPLLEAWERLKRLITVPITLPLALLSTPVAGGFFTLANYLAHQRLEIVDDQAPSAQNTQRTFRLMSLNVCFQEGFAAPIEGGVVPPFERVGAFPSRVAAIAHWIATHIVAPDLFLGQEFSDLHAQDAFVAEMRRHGYRFFILDRAPHAVLYNSGLLVASKYRLDDISFIPFPLKDRYLGGMTGQKGALQFSLFDQHGRRLIRLINTHLNAHSGPGAESARQRQMRTHILPHFQNHEVPTVLVGDLNFDTSDRVLKRESGLEPYINICEGQVTCTNEGMAHLRSPNTPLLEERIDAIIANSQAIAFSNLQIQKVVAEQALLSDHYAVSSSATV